MNYNGPIYLAVTDPKGCEAVVAGTKLAIEIARCEMSGQKDIRVLSYCWAKYWVWLRGISPMNKPYDNQVDGKYAVDIAGNPDLKCGFVLKRPYQNISS